MTTYQANTLRNRAKAWGVCWGQGHRLCLGLLFAKVGLPALASWLSVSSKEILSSDQVAAFFCLQASVVQVHLPTVLRSFYTEPWLQWPQGRIHMSRTGSPPRPSVFLRFMWTLCSTLMHVVLLWCKCIWKYDASQLNDLSLFHSDWSIPAAVCETIVDPGDKMMAESLLCEDIPLSARVDNSGTVSCSWYHLQSWQCLVEECCSEWSHQFVP